MQTDIVIAHYKEDLFWIQNLDNQLFKPVIYSKGPDVKGIQLLNIGRESHTYCHHIINNWDKLSDFTIFCQGNPFDHCANFLNMINVPQGTMLTDQFFKTDGNGCPQHCGLRVEKYLYLLKDRELPLEFGAGAQFKVSKETIWSLGWQYWDELHHLHYHEEQFGWIIERFWKKMLLI